MTETIQIALKTLEAQLNQPLETALEACARCGLCAEACHYYRAEPKVEHIPAYRAERLRDVYRYEHDMLSRLFPAWTGAKKLDEPMLANLTEIAFSQCTLCRRCTVNCPLGVDTPLMMRAIRAMATASGTAPEILVMLADVAIEKGKDPSFYKEMFLEQIKEMEEQLRDITGDPNATIPVEKQGAKILYVPLAGAHTILPPAVVFNAAKEDWTLSIFEAANYGVFLADVNRAKQVAKRIVDEANRLGVKEIVIAECGHAYASYRWDVPNWFAGEFDFKVRSMIEVLAEYIQDGKIKVDPTAIPESVTYHDSCNLARNGGLIEEPRYVLGKISSDFREMTPNRAEAICCGGGGGLVALAEYTERRIAAGKPKADQVKKTGARVVVAACENCRLQLGDLNEHYNLNVRITALTDLVVRAMRLPKPLPGTEAEHLFEGEEVSVVNSQ
ncbi:MAG: (Fe-S)-binding protein [Candidatus Diapherotrites archaeon]|nr:(Fe-S)-binding protein [Candidatus Diapherotrites archaeon]